MANDTKRAYEAALAQLKPTLRKAFLDAVADIRSGTRLAALEEAVAAGDWRAAVEILRMDERVFDRLDRAVENAFYQGGVYQMAHLGGRGAALSVRFQGRHPRAERWTRERSSGLITEVIEDQKEAVRVQIQSGVVDGRNPRSTALDIVGRVQDGKRRGGIVGLHSQQAAWVNSLRAELASGDENYFERKARDKRFDSTVRRAFDAGKPVSAADIDRIATRYADRLLKLRGDTIARTETIAAMNAGRYEALEQLVERDEVSRADIKVVWSATMDSRTRDLHMSLNGTRIGLGETFQSDTGARLRFPGDTSLGARGADTINCRCYMQPRIDWLARAT